MIVTINKDKLKAIIPNQDIIAHNAWISRQQVNNICNWVSNPNDYTLRKIIKAINNYKHKGYKAQNTNPVKYEDFVV
jgi:hypothetical protein